MTDELARVKRIGKPSQLEQENSQLLAAMSMVPADWELSALAEVSALRAQNAELLAALRECANSLESEVSAQEFDGHSTIHAARMARKARAVIAKAEGTP